MDIVLSHFSALQYWRHNPADLRHRNVIAGQTSLPGAPKVEDIHAARLDSFGLKPPYELAVSPLANRRAPKNVTLHESARELPPNSIVQVAPGIQVVSPELCFLQCAHLNRSLARLVLLGYELCGGYVLRGDLPAGFTQCASLTSVTRLEALVASAGKHPGCKLARRALPYIADGAASPAESLLAALLVLPTNVGGYGFELPELNARVDLPKDAQVESKRGYFKCDLLWREAGVGVEYNGAWHYDAHEQRNNDVVRANILEDLGIGVAVVTAPQLYDVDAFGAFAQHLAHRLGRRLRIRAAGFDAKRRQTHAELTAPSPTA